MNMYWLGETRSLIHTSCVPIILSLCLIKNKSEDLKQKRRSIIIEQLLDFSFYYMRKDFIGLFFSLKRYIALSNTQSNFNVNPRSDKTRLNGSGWAFAS